MLKSIGADFILRLPRYFNNINRLAERFPIAHTGSEEEVTVWCSNDYLGMGRNPHVLETMKLAFLPSIVYVAGPCLISPFHRRQTLSKYGAGAGGTRNIAGNNALHLALEAEVADLHQKPAGLIFSSCYVANDATRKHFLNSSPLFVIIIDFTLYSRHSWLEASQLRISIRFL